MSKPSKITKTAKEMGKPTLAPKGKGRPGVVIMIGVGKAKKGK